MSGDESTIEDLRRRVERLEARVEDEDVSRREFGKAGILGALGLGVSVDSNDTFGTSSTGSIFSDTDSDGIYEQTTGDGISTSNLSVTNSFDAAGLVSPSDLGDPGTPVPLMWLYLMGEVEMGYRQNFHGGFYTTERFADKACRSWSVGSFGSVDGRASRPSDPRGDDGSRYSVYNALKKSSEDFRMTKSTSGSIGGSTLAHGSKNIGAKGVNQITLSISGSTIKGLRDQNSASSGETISATDSSITSGKWGVIGANTASNEHLRGDMAPWAAELLAPQTKLPTAHAVYEVGVVEKPAPEDEETTVVAPDVPDGVKYSGLDNKPRKTGTYHVAVYSPEDGKTVRKAGGALLGKVSADGPAAIHAKAERRDSSMLTDSAETRYLLSGDESLEPKSVAAFYEREVGELGRLDPDEDGDVDAETLDNTLQMWADRASESRTSRRLRNLRLGK